MLGQCPSGDITFNTQGEVDLFIVQYPDCVSVNGSIFIEHTNPYEETAISNLDALHNITTIAGSLTVHGQGVLGLRGLNSLTHLGDSLIINDTSINDLIPLNNLTYIGSDLHLISNPITSLAPLNNLSTLGGDLIYKYGDYYNSLLAFDLDFNVQTLGGELYIQMGPDITNVDGLNSLTSINGSVFIEGAAFTSFRGLENVQTIGGFFSIDGFSALTSLSPLSSLTSVGGISINAYGVTNLNGLENLTTCNGTLVISSPTISDISALHNLTNSEGLGIFTTQLTSLHGLENLAQVSNSYMHISNNNQLTDISALGNIDPTSIYSLYISDCPQLATCSIPNICSYIQTDSGRRFGFSDNAEGCNTLNEVIYNCNLGYNNSLQGIVQFNFNNSDCSLPNSSAAPNVRIKAIRSDGIQYVTYTVDDGTYELFVPEGTYTVTADEYMEHFSIPNDTLNVTFAGAGGIENNNFCIVADEVIDDIKTTILPFTEAKPGFDIQYRVVIQNTGTIEKIGTVNITYDTSKLTYLSSDNENAVVDIDLGIITFDYNLQPLGLTPLTLKFNIAPPPVSEIGQLITLIASATVSENDATPEDNTCTYEQTLVGSFDPNDKSVIEGEEVLIENIDGYLTYRIRFQNTGTASATYVRLEDLLDNKLDVNTFEPVSASHSNHRIKLIDRNLIINFDNITLPASMYDEPGSHGFFIYKIKPQQDVMVGDVISNTAQIYFDYNTPIVTNTVSTTFVEEIAGIDVYSFDVALYPNPAQSIINIKGKLPVTSVYIYNNIGQEVIKINDNNGIGSFNITGLANGVYVCHIKNANGEVAVKKIIINK